MSVRREDTASKPDELQLGSSWIPATPAKATSSHWPPICTNWGENQKVQANWLEMERLAPTNQVAQGDFVQQTQFQREPACYDSLGVNNASRAANNWHTSMPTNSHVYEENLVGFDSWLARDSTNSHVFAEGSSKFDKLSNVSFGDLLNAMSKKAEMENAHTHNNFATSSSSDSCFRQRSLLEDPLARSGVSTPYFHPRVVRSQFTMSSGNASLQDQHTILGANFDAEMRIPNTVTGKFTISD